MNNEVKVSDMDNVLEESNILVDNDKRNPKIIKENPDGSGTHVRAIQSLNKEEFNYNYNYIGFVQAFFCS